VNPNQPPASLAWLLEKGPKGKGKGNAPRPLSYVYDALVGERLLLYGIYPHLLQASDGDGPTYFEVFEVYERAIRRFLARWHIVRPSRRYGPIFCSQSADNASLYVSQAPFYAPSPSNRRGVMKLMFNDDLGNVSGGLMSVYFPGTASAEFKPNVKVGAHGGGGELGSFRGKVNVKPVREDPVVNLRPVVGEDLGNYVREYIPSIFEGTPVKVPEEEVSELARTAGAGSPIEVQFYPNPIDRNLEPGESLDFDVSIIVQPSSTSMVALRATTKAGDVLTDILEIGADNEGRTYLL
jgi:hypothetical protein